MVIRNEVCSFEQAQKLELLLGALSKNKHSFYWVEIGDSYHIGYYCNKGLVFVDEDGEVYTESGVTTCPAFTVAELGIMLPEWITKEKVKYRRHQWFNEKDFLSSSPVVSPLDGFVGAYQSEYVNHNHQRTNIPSHIKGFPTEAQHRAAMLIYLLENKFVKAKDVNEKLK